MKALSKKEFLSQPVNFRIETIIGDGMWYSITKWRKLAQVTEDELLEWIQDAQKTGFLVKSETGAQSYRYNYDGVADWHKRLGINIGDQVVNHIFPARCWDGMTETEGFLKAPLRRIDVVTFRTSPEEAKKAIEALKGIAKVREPFPGTYRAYCSSGSYVRSIIENNIKLFSEDNRRPISVQVNARRRELKDFSPEFCEGLIQFYGTFAKSLVKPALETIKIFCPTEDERDAQILSWVIFAIEKFNESEAVPFSGYLDSVLKRWPYDLPVYHLGPELSSFQRERSKALKSLKKEFPDTQTFTVQEVSQRMGYTVGTYNDLSERSQMWTRGKNATSLTWDEGDEKLSEKDVISDNSGSTHRTDNTLAHKISVASLKAGLETRDYTSTFTVISQIDNSKMNLDLLSNLPKNYVRSFSKHFSEVNSEK